MSFVSASKNSFSVRAYIGDKKTLLAFNFSTRRARRISLDSPFIANRPVCLAITSRTNCNFRIPATQAGRGRVANSSVNAPIQKYRWTHYLGSVHQGLTPVLGNYTYTCMLRYFDNKQSMTALYYAPPSTTVTVPVGPFKKGSVRLGFTRGVYYRSVRPSLRQEHSGHAQRQAVGLRHQFAGWYR